MDGLGPPERPTGRVWLFAESVPAQEEYSQQHPKRVVVSAHFVQEWVQYIRVARCCLVQFQTLDQTAELVLGFLRIKLPRSGEQRHQPFRQHERSEQPAVDDRVTSLRSLSKLLDVD